MTTRRDAFIDAMGLGPRWVLREAQAMVPEASVAAPAAAAGAARSAGGSGWLFVTNEDTTGTPAGRLLDNMLAALGLTLGEQVELAAALADEQIALLQPAVIVALGSATLAPGLHRHGETPLVVTHSLATLLSTPRAKAEAWGHLCLAADQHGG